MKYGIANAVKTVTIDRMEYQIFMPFNSQDMNIHFVDALGNDALVDIQDVCDFIGLPGVTVDQAIIYARFMVADGMKFYWKMV